MKREKKSTIKILFFGFSLLFSIIAYGGIIFQINITDKSNDVNSYIPKTSAFYTITSQITIDDWETDNNSYVWINGAGTWVDPYAIENVTFDVGQDQSGLIIKDSDIYFTIKNCTFKNSEYIYGEDDGVNDFKAGVYLINVTNGIIENNTFEDNTIGIYSAPDCKNITISESKFFNNKAHAIYLEGKNFIISDNIMTYSGIKISGKNFNLNSKTHDIGTSNTFNGNPVYYIANQSGIDSSYFGMDTPGQVIAVNVNHSTFSGLNLVGGSIIFQLLNSFNTTISYNNFTNAYLPSYAAGIFVQGSFNTTIEGNNVTHCLHGIRLVSSYYSKIIGNKLFNNTAYGVYGDDTYDTNSQNTIYNNQFIDNIFAAIGLVSSSGYNVSDNDIIRLFSK